MLGNASPCSPRRGAREIGKNSVLDGKSPEKLWKSRKKEVKCECDGRHTSILGGMDMEERNSAEVVDYLDTIQSLAESILDACAEVRAAVIGGATTESEAGR